MDIPETVSPESNARPAEAPRSGRHALQERLLARDPYQTRCRALCERVTDAAPLIASVVGTVFRIPSPHYRELHACGVKQLVIIQKG